MLGVGDMPGQKNQQWQDNFLHSEMFDQRYEINKGVTA